jgi:hypothetical protein|tara:strand:+ start:132 stop:794 length:663 start_codon:yes stop_codon:yes gene_type:complete
MTLRIGDMNRLIRHLDRRYARKPAGPSRAIVTADALSSSGVQNTITVRMLGETAEHTIPYVGPSPAVGDTVRIEWRGQPTAVGVIGGGAWTTYTPAWTATTTNPTIGNGTLTGAYRMVGRTSMVWRMTMVYGSTSTAGSGTWSFGLPTNVDAATVATSQLSHGRLLDAGSSTGLSESQPLSAGNPNMFTVLSEGIEAITDSTLVWASGDTIILCGTFELA